MPHDPALEAHEQAEHANHGAHDPFVARVTLTVATLAILAAVAGSLESIEAGRALSAASEAVLAQDEATDAWNEYEAQSLKKHMYGIAAATAGTKADQFRKIEQAEALKQEPLRQTAKSDEARRDHLLGDSRHHEDRHHGLTAAATLFEIGIAMSTVAIISRRRWLLTGASIFGAVGAVVLALVYLA